MPVVPARTFFGLTISLISGYTLIVTCRLNGIDPESYLRYVIREISEWPSNRLRDLLPWSLELPLVKADLNRGLVKAFNQHQL
ncbi:transposase domain-containing protein [Salmonella enterica]|uniref:Transposase domain-containing protein n=1 Tax=Salmonella enterica TaxID=28901 RepID=A0ACC5L3C9_SALER|nr:transposase domain-containing protein [Salmonella enterica]